eukprot:4544011-Pleurochrysis_carterae.AAC.1
MSGRGGECGSQRASATGLACFVRTATNKNGCRLYPTCNEHLLPWRAKSARSCEYELVSPPSLLATSHFCVDERPLPFCP